MKDSMLTMVKSQTVRSSQTERPPRAWTLVAASGKWWQCYPINTCWLGNWHRTDVMLLAYWAISFLIDFSTLRGIRPETLVMISCNSRRGREGSLRVFINRSTQSFTCRERNNQMGYKGNTTPQIKSDPWISCTECWCCLLIYSFYVNVDHMSASGLHMVWPTMLGAHPFQEEQVL